MPEKILTVQKNSILKNLIYMSVFLLAATGIGQIFWMQQTQETNIVLAYILAVLMTARFADRFLWGVSAAVIATFAYNFFFTEPRFSFSVNNSDYLTTFVWMTAAAVFTSALTMETRRYARRALEQEKELHTLYTLTNELSRADNIEKIMETAERNISAMLGYAVKLQCSRRTEKLDASYPGEIQKEAEKSFLIRGQEGVLGRLEVLQDSAGNISEESLELLHTMLENIGIAMDRVYSLEERYRNQKLMEQEKYKTNLLRAISHDLRTPLMGIMGTAEMIEGMSVQEDPRYKLARDIYQDADWLHSLVENILGLTRLSDGSRMLSRVPESLEEIVSSAIRRIEKRAPGYEIEARLPEEYIEIMADPRLLEQVFINLLDNAVKHTPPGGEIRMVIGRQGPDRVQIEVMDRGEGIPEKDISNIFQMFYTSSQRPADTKSGAGLGLSICETIVKAHGGTITARNREGRGAVFTLNLPLYEKGEDHV